MPRQPAAFLAIIARLWRHGILRHIQGIPPLLPGYRLLHWEALLQALSDLVRDPASWRKTEHGKAERDLAA